jgi:hypothetical protein
MNEIFKDGSSVIDERLDRLEHFDERSRSYAVDTSGWEPVRKMWQYPTVLNQLNTGGCTAFGMSHLLLSTPLSVKKPKLDAQFARVKIYYPSQKNDPWPGGEYPGAYPVYGGTSVLTMLQTVKQLGLITEYKWNFSLEDVILTIGNDRPIGLGTTWYDTMSEPDKDGFISPRNGKKVGGHFCVIIGVDPYKHFVTILNSWGGGWGDDGTAKMTFDSLAFLMRSGSEQVAVYR